MSRHENGFTMRLELGHPRAIEMVLEGLERVPRSEGTWENFSDPDDEEIDGQAFEEFDASVETLAEDLEQHRKYGGMGSFVLEYQRMAELGHEEAAKRLAEMGDASTKAIVDMLRPVDGI